MFKEDTVVIYVFHTKNPFSRGRLYKKVFENNKLCEVAKNFYKKAENLNLHKISDEITIIEENLESNSMCYDKAMPAIITYNGHEKTLLGTLLVVGSVGDDECIKSTKVQEEDIMEIFYPSNKKSDE